MSQQPYGAQQYPSPYGQPAAPYGAAALQGARATTAGKQLLVWLLDGVIFGLPLTLLSFLSFLPLIFTTIEIANDHSRRHNLDELSSSQAASIFGSIAIAIVATGVLLLVYYFIYWWLIATKGRTPGMSIMGLRLVSIETGQPIGWGQAFLRGLVVVLGSQLTGGIGGLLFWLSPLFDSTTGWAQSWQDKLVKAVIIDTKNGRDTFNQA
ncbi:RDD family protein [Psychromicrobium lacuslunae]|uniref:RDD family protein n=1 Tax=Psychromicrobium lacuslunae TaxID=1618207 RepID=UPI0006960256|nr:RDD family protein [Psychromicrobium lacuslunae]